MANNKEYLTAPSQANRETRIKHDRPGASQGRPKPENMTDRRLIGYPEKGIPPSKTK